MSARKLERVPFRNAKLNEMVWGAILDRLWDNWSAIKKSCCPAANSS